MPVVVSMKCVKGLLVALCTVYVLVSDHVYCGVLDTHFSQKQFVLFLVSYVSDCHSHPSYF